MVLTAENLVIAWDQVKAEFVNNKTLKNKNLLVAMMYEPWELCDDVFANLKWSKANEFTLPAKKTLCEVAAKHLFSAWAWIWCGGQHTSTNRPLHTFYDTYPTPV